MSASNTSETIPNEKTEKVEETKIGKLKSKILLKLAFIKELPIKLLKKRQPVTSDTDQPEQQPEQ